MRAITLLMTSVAGWMAMPVTAQETRQLGAHVHGEAHLAIVVEGRSIAMELHAPGADIVGFEHVPSTDAQRATVAAATNTFRDPIALFGIPAAAGCTVGKSEVEVAEEDAAAGPGGAPAAKHTEFEVAYELTCNNVAAITSLNFAFFAKFPNAMEMAVQILSGRGAFEFEVERARPMVNTGNMF